MGFGDSLVWVRILVQLLSMLLAILTFVKHLAFLLESEPLKGRGLALFILKSLDIQ